MACRRLAAIYERDPGEVSKQAPTLYAGACNAGDAEACLGLGAVYRDGRLGYLKDAAQATMLYEKACTAGSDAGCALSTAPAAAAKGAGQRPAPGG